MKLRWKQLAAALLAVAMLLTLLPFTKGGSALAAGTYGRTTASDVAVRKEAGTSSPFWFRVEKGTIATVLSTKTVKGVTWYRVVLKNPSYENSNTYYGYIHGDFFELLSETEAAAWENNPLCVKGTAEVTAPPTAGSGVTAPPAVTAVPGVVTTAYAPASGTIGTIKNSGVNIRQEPSMSAFRLYQVDRGTEVTILEIPASTDPDPWYKVSYMGSVGYIMAQFVTVEGVNFATPTPTPITVPGGTVTPTPVPGTTSGTVPAVAESVDGAYVRLLLSSTTLYYTPNGAAMATWNNIGSTLPLAGSPAMQVGYTWYPVAINGTIAYVRGDAVQRTDAPGAQASTTIGGTGTQPSTVTAPPAQTVLGYVITTRGDVNLRLKPAGQMIQQVNRGVVCPLLAAPVNDSGYDWYYVQVDNVRGYLRGDCVAYCNADGSLINGTSTATAQPVVNTGYIKTVVDNVNLRRSPAGATLEQIPINTVLALTGSPKASGNYLWYPVKSATGRSGYLRSDCVAVTDASGNESATAAPVTATPVPTGSAYGYVQAIKGGVNLRKTPAGAGIGQVQKGSVWPMTGAVVRESGYDWYPVDVNGKKGYLRGDCVAKLSETQAASYLAGNGVPVESPTPTPSPTPEPVYVVQTIVDKVYLRKSASRDSAALDQVAVGTVMNYSGKTTSGGNVWYNITYGSTKAWVLGSCVKELTPAEYAAWLAANPTVTTAPPTTSNLGYIKTVKGGVNVRPSAGSKKTIGQVARNLVFAYTATAKSGSYTWYKVTTAYGVGWLRGDCVEPCQADGSMIPPTIITPSPTDASGVVVNTSAVEASYTILKLGSSGNNVQKLVQALKDQGYFTGTVSNVYTEEVQNAVSTFQKAKGLTVDGIAGSQTQHALFGTVPVGTYDGSDMSMVLYPAEKIDWFTGGIQELWPRGANVKVYDVKTGIVWWAHRWAGAYHADIEPLTAADTSRLCAIYGVSTPQQIVSKNLYQRRPSLITIGNHTYACALYGVPHNYGAGDISNNNFPGQICMHFTNSKTHGTKIVYYLNTQAIQYAWENAPNGHK